MDLDSELLTDYDFWYIGLVKHIIRRRTWNRKWTMRQITDFATKAIMFLIARPNNLYLLLVLLITILRITIICTESHSRFHTTHYHRHHFLPIYICVHEALTTKNISLFINHTTFQSLILYTYAIDVIYTHLPVSPVRLTVAIFLPILRYYLYRYSMFSIVSYWRCFTLAFKNKENISSAYTFLPETWLGFFRRLVDDGESRAELRLAIIINNTYNTTSAYLPLLLYFIMQLLLLLVYLFLLPSHHKNAFENS